MFTLKEIADVLKIANFAPQVPGDEKIISSVSTDSRSDCSDSIFFALKGETFDGHDYVDQAVASGAKTLCVSNDFSLSSRPGIDVLKVDDTLAAYHALARHHRGKMNCKVIAVTGSSGKTSTKEMISSILRQLSSPSEVIATEGNTNNHFGVPQNIFSITPAHKFAVLEVGINHFGEMQALRDMAIPDIAVVSSIGDAHLEFLGDRRGVAREKSVIFTPVTGRRPPVAVFPADCEANDILINSAAGQIMTFSKADNGNHTRPHALQWLYLGGNIHGSSFRFLPGRWRWSEKIQWGLAGAHQVSNAAAAALASIAAGAEPHHVEQGLRNCSLPGMRMRVSNIDNVTWINDAYNANPDSMKASLDWLAEFANNHDTVVVLGDMLELGNDSPRFHHDVLLHAHAKLPAARIVTVGPRMLQAAQAIQFPTRNIISFQDSASASNSIDSITNDAKTIFIKASRGIKLEKIIPADKISGMPRA